MEGCYRDHLGLEAGAHNTRGQLAKGTDFFTVASYIFESSVRDDT
jgi:hypothetical protein